MEARVGDRNYQQKLLNSFFFFSKKRNLKWVGSSPNGYSHHRDVCKSLLPGSSKNQSLPSQPPVCSSLANSCDPRPRDLQLTS